MIQISRDDVVYLATLSSLQLSDDEIDALTTDIDTIVGYIHQLAELDTTGTEPTYQVTGLENVYRDDKIQPGLEGAQLVALAPESQNSQIKVPKVL